MRTTRAGGDHPSMLHVTFLTDRFPVPAPKVDHIRSSAAPVGVRKTSIDVHANPYRVRPPSSRTHSWAARWSKYRTDPRSSSPCPCAPTWVGRTGSTNAVSFSSACTTKRFPSFSVRVRNTNCLPVGIDRRDTAPTPSGFAKSVCSADACH